MRNTWFFRKIVTKSRYISNSGHESHLHSALPLKDAYLSGFHEITLRPWEVYFPNDITAPPPENLCSVDSDIGFYVSISLWAIYPSYRTNISLLHVFARQRPNFVFFALEQFPPAEFAPPENLNEIAIYIQFMAWNAPTFCVRRMLNFV